MVGLVLFYSKRGRPKRKILFCYEYFMYLDASMVVKVCLLITVNKVKNTMNQSKEQKKNRK